jgi:hypothetical protein
LKNSSVVAAWARCIKGVQTNLDRPVAIKILPPGVEKEDPSFAERFKNEARLMAQA